MRLADELESLLEDGPQNSRFHIELSSAIREFGQDWGRSPEQLRTEICDSEIEHPLINFFVGLSRWIEDRDYEDGAKPALENLRAAIDVTIEEDWDELFPELVVQRIRLLDDLNHAHELEAEVNLGLCFLKEKEESIPIGPVFDILDAISDNLHSISGTPTVRALADYIENHAEKAIKAGDYRNYRHLWRRDLDIRKASDLDVDSAIEAIVKSYNDEIESLKLGEKHSNRAIVAKEAIIECNDWVDENQRVEWERAFINGNKMSIEQMGEISQELSEDDVDELDDTLESFVSQFRDHKENTHTIFAIKWLLNQSIFVPDIENARAISEGSIMNIIQGVTVTEAGESYSQNEGTVNLPSSYGVMVQFTQKIRQSVYYRLQNRELIKEGDLFILFNRRHVLSADTHAYLTDFVIHLFEQNHSAAIHIGMSQLEAVIRELATDNGKSILSVDEDELGRRSMGSLLYQIEGEVSESWVTYLRYRYTNASGQNIRNKIAHGYLPYPQAAWGMSITLLFDILQNFLEFEEAYG